MSDLRNALGLLSLVAACGPVAATTTTGEDTTATDTTGSASDPTGSASDPTDPTAPTSDATDATTTPPPECVDSGDCDGTYCGYCEDGMCVEGVGCCGFAATVRPDMSRFRCQPPYECYGDEDCGPDQICDASNTCTLPVPLQLPPCPGQVFSVTPWFLDATPSAFVLVDLDADGDLDLAAAQPSVAQIQIALNDGAGGFTVAGAFGVGAPSEGLALAASNLDADPGIDLAVVRNDPAGGLILLFGKDAVFTPQPALPTAPQANAVFIRDLDGDLVNDLVVVSASDVTTRNGTDLETEIVAFPGPIGDHATMFDIDASGAPDLLAPEPNSTTVGIYTAAPGGKFTASVFIDTLKDQVASLGGDLTQPGVDDLPALVLARSVDGLGQIDVFHGEASPMKFGDVDLYQTSLPITGATLQELGGPQGPDLLAATGMASFLVALGDADGGFSCEMIVPVDDVTTLGLLAAGDVNNDGRVDFVVGDTDSSSVSVLLQQ